MKKFYLLTYVFIGLVFTSGAQSFSLKDLMEFSGSKADKFTTQILKKDYRRDYNNDENRNTFTYRKEVKGQVIHRAISFRTALNEEIVIYKTSSPKDRQELEGDIERAGFRNYSVRQTPERVLQKEEYSISVQTEIADSIQLYTYQVTRRRLPEWKNIAYAEDLLPLTSHEFVATVFGNQNVKQDVFHYSSTERNNCTILYPGTEREVIFIWEDQDNFRDIGVLVFGGSVETNTTVYKQLRQNQWTSKQGVHSGMSLKELEEKNGGPVSFYGWASDMAGTLVPTNSGNLDFKRLGLVLDCMNCKGNAYEKASVVSSAKDMENSRIYVSTIIIIPEKQKQVTALR